MSTPLPGQVPSWFPIAEVETYRNIERALDNIVATESVFEVTEHFGHQNDEGSLRVLRAPHIVRPPSDTGVVYRESLFRTPQLSFKTPPRLPAYACNAIERETQHRLCQACLDAFNYYAKYLIARPATRGGLPNLVMSNAVVHHHYLYTLIAFATMEQCYICQRLLERIKYYLPEALLAKNLKHFQIEMCWKQATNPRERGRIQFVLTDPTKKKDLMNNMTFYGLDIWPTQTYSHYLEPRSENDEITTGMAQGQKSCAEAQDLVVSWLSRCRSNEGGAHVQCNMRNDGYLPTRLLDVEHAKSTSHVRLVCTESNPPLNLDGDNFITLSHCWGEWGAKNNPVLNLHNLIERQRKGLRVADLPKSFRDAIEIASWFNVRWLWIDSLCIIQDSADDWVREASLMAQTYKNALLNISADFAADSRGGCFFQRDTLEITPLKLRAPELAQSWYFIPYSDSHFEWMNDMHSLSRAWIYRERQLSRRIIYFTKKEIVWECCGTDGAGFASETFPGGAPFKTTFQLDNKYQISGLQQGTIDRVGEVYEMWYDTCQNLSRKHLTKATDMPVVLSSLAEEFAALLPDDQFVAGLWQATLPQSLLWTINEQQAKISGDYIAPSWSWVSSGCKVKLPHRSSLDKWVGDTIAVVQDISIKLANNDQPFGRLEAGSLTLEGYLRPVQLRFKKSTFELYVYEGNKNVGRCRRIGKNWDAYKGDLCEAFLDRILPSRKVECFCLFITIQKGHRDDIDQTIESLLLQSTGRDGKTFKRIGTLTFKHEYALGMRYIIKAGFQERKIWHMMLNRVKSVPDDESKTKREQGFETGRSSGQDEVNGVDRPRKSDPALLYQFDGDFQEDCLERLTTQIVTIL